MNMVAGPVTPISQDPVSTTSTTATATTTLTTTSTSVTLVSSYGGAEVVGPRSFTVPPPSLGVQGQAGGQQVYQPYPAHSPGNPPLYNPHMPPPSHPPHFTQMPPPPVLPPGATVYVANCHVNLSSSYNGGQGHVPVLASTPGPSQSPPPPSPAVVPQMPVMPDTVPQPHPSQVKPVHEGKVEYDGRRNYDPLRGGHRGRGRGRGRGKRLNIERGGGEHPVYGGDKHYHEAQQFGGIQGQQYVYQNLPYHMRGGSGYPSYPSVPTPQNVQGMPLMYGQQYVQYAHAPGPMTPLLSYHSGPTGNQHHPAATLQHLHQHPHHHPLPQQQHHHHFHQQQHHHQQQQQPEPESPQQDHQFHLQQTQPQPNFAEPTEVAGSSNLHSNQPFVSTSQTRTSQFENVTTVGVSAPAVNFTPSVTAPAEAGSVSPLTSQTASLVLEDCVETGPPSLGIVSPGHEASVPVGQEGEEATPQPTTQELPPAHHVPLHTLQSIPNMQVPPPGQSQAPTSGQAQVPPSQVQMPPPAQNQVPLPSSQVEFTPGQVQVPPHQNQEGLPLQPQAPPPNQNQPQPPCQNQMPSSQTHTPAVVQIEVAPSSHNPAAPPSQGPVPPPGLTQSQPQSHTQVPPSSLDLGQVPPSSQDQSPVLPPAHAQVPQTSHVQAPPPGHTQVPPTSHVQAPASHTQAPPPGLVQAPPGLAQAPPPGLPQVPPPGLPQVPPPGLAQLPPPCQAQIPAGQVQELPSGQIQTPPAGQVKTPQMTGPLHTSPSHPQAPAKVISGGTGSSNSNNYGNKSSSTPQVLFSQMNKNKMGVGIEQTSLADITFMSDEMQPDVATEIAVDFARTSLVDPEPTPTPPSVPFTPAPAVPVSESPAPTIPQVSAPAAAPEAGVRQVNNDVGMVVPSANPPVVVSPVMAVVSSPVMAESVVPQVAATTAPPGGAWAQKKSWSQLFKPCDEGGAKQVAYVAPLTRDLRSPVRRPHGHARPRNAKHQILHFQKLTWRKPKLEYVQDHHHAALQPRGLINKANWCYINAPLQALLACPPFYNLMKTIPNIVGLKKGKSSTPVIDSIVEYIHEFSEIAPMLKPCKKDKGGGGARKEAEIVPGPPFEPSYVYKMLATINGDLFSDGRQQDAEEMFSFVLNGLHEEMVEALKVAGEYSPSPTGDQPALNGSVNGETNTSDHEDGSDDSDEWQMMGPRKRCCVTRTAAFTPTPISAIFWGQLRSVLHQAGGHTTANLQPFTTLPLDIQSSKVENVKDALDQLVSREEIPDYTDAKTNQDVTVFKQVLLEHLPNVLILQLKRFIYDKDGGLQKVMKKVNFPVDLEITKELMSTHSRGKFSPVQRKYKLLGVVYHDGKEATKGHYVADIYHGGYNCWLRCDDSFIKEVPEAYVVRHVPPRVPYLLLYRRADTMVGPSTKAKS
ncbi:Ubiquitin carboxyl-terminal hydrolase 10 [Chionoecetes opilio]|uniref:ubiquitinyl hydrolase 1 n=1 Tax=Chionoecetes opilio TaxID=41210 RepID=A0A8J5CLC9_CHIOP|nr:Ubiquitin carboxyl-terminal hydrolase 10 [Chionoecetes opilio]